MSWGAATGMLKQGMQNEMKTGKQRNASDPTGQGYGTPRPMLPQQPAPIAAIPAAGGPAVGQSEAPAASPQMSPLEQMLSAIMRRPIR